MSRRAQPAAAPEPAPGYRSAAYAASFAGVARPRALTGCGGWLLERAIPGSTRRDAMGPYPLLCCGDWRALAADLDAIGRELVSVTAVTDPFAGVDAALLEAAFRDRVQVYKRHYLVDLRRAPLATVSRHNRRHARRALAEMDIEVCARPERHLPEWIALYRGLVARHRIAGLAAFPDPAFAAQFRVPGLTVLRAHRDGETLAMQLWMVHGRDAYYHLGASSAHGYARHASYALMWAAIERFAAHGLERLDLGAGAGATARADDGLARFKRGFANDEAPVWLCGRVLDRAAYEALAAGRGPAAAGYFPGYRHGEFA